MPFRLCWQRAIQRRFQERHDALVRTIGAGDVELGIGIGMDNGDTNFGTFGQTHRDLTAVGTVVNRAPRAQAMAKSGEIRVTTAVRDRTRDMITASGSDYRLKGFDQPVTRGKKDGSSVPLRAEAVGMVVCRLRTSPQRRTGGFVPAHLNSF
ncbi:hypothetical protein HAP47_0020445 [Bradyrhizobium sp. 41S5]|uniref:adenylate/guanylate cyclase domain-containing protein n=1 Tax=Bradyrhizobium sp. 41S5 TaxID=1404443 RepID=UPI00156B2F05|nr:adenylate/guanylate cyclase domain-containing protein [Bradyrhizobium sp. 41S5]UFX41688.1 hypothetical protein HAP47_0020445 [Bradyrhizobium sp. 41S5]